jgi:hypothetical protein
MNRNKPRRKKKASLARAEKFVESEANLAKRKSIDLRSVESNTRKGMLSVPTVVRVVKSSIIISGSSDVPPAIESFQERASQHRHNAHNIPSVPIFNRRDAYFAYRLANLEQGDIFEKVGEALDDLDQTTMEVGIKYFGIFGVKKEKKGTRFVSGVLDDHSRTKLQFQANIIRSVIGLEPLDSVPPYHVSMLRTTDQLEAEQSSRDCNRANIKMQLELSAPTLKAISQPYVAY